MEHGVVERRPYGNHPNRFDYRLIPKGEDSIPIYLTLAAWGDRWEAGQPGPPTHVVHQSCGRTTQATVHCSECGERLRLQDLTYHRGPGSRRGVGTELLQTHLEPAWERAG